MLCGFKMTDSNSTDINVFPDYWKNDFRNLSCPYYGPDSKEHFQLIWDNKSYGYKVELLSHVCLNGSFSHLPLEEWNERCFPTHMESIVQRRLTGFWSLFNYILGLFGNLLTLVAIPYAKWKRRYKFDNTFWTTDIWVLHLAFCDLIFTIFCAPHYFIPYLGSRYPLGYGWDTACTTSFIITILTFTNDWLLVAVVAMTRAMMVKAPSKWNDFCNNKIYVFLFLISTWIFQLLVMLPIFLQPSIDIGYNCLMGKCNYVPTGKDPLKVFVGFVGQPVFVGLPYLAAFLLPCIITVVSYVIIWLKIRKVKRNLKNMRRENTKENDGGRLSKTEMKFVWTVFIICACYLLCALPGIVLVDIFGMKDENSFLLSLCLLWFQFSINIFIYAYRSEHYRAAYWDMLVLIFPCLLKLREKGTRNLLASMFPCFQNHVEKEKMDQLRTKENQTIDTRYQTSDTTK